MLKFYRDVPFNSATELTPVDYFVADGITNAYPILNKSPLEVGNTVQVDAAEYFRHNNGFVINNKALSLSVIPVFGAHVVIPGISGLILSAFDKSTVSGITNPRVAEVACYIADPEEIAIFRYLDSASNGGIPVSWVDNTCGIGASSNWMQFAPALANGSAGTYGAAGGAVVIPEIKDQTTLTNSYFAGTTSITVASASGFVAGQYIAIGAPTYEIVHLTAVSGTILTISGTNFTHNTGEPVYVDGYKFWIKMTIPEDIADNTAISLYNLGLRRVGKAVTR